jgi:hypothetical protein
MKMRFDWHSLVRNSHPVPETQEDLATAHVSYLQSLVSYQKAIIELQRVRASFLQDFRVQFLDKPVQERAAREKAAK